MARKKMKKAILKVAASAMAFAVVFGSVVPAQATYARRFRMKDVFDANYYTSTYGDLNINFGSDARKLYNHFVKFGRAEERNFCTLIDVKKYRAEYPDLSITYGDNWDAYVNHYLQYGYDEGRKSFGTFNARAYADRYPDLKAAFGYDVWLLYRHYLLYGIKEGRDATYHEPVVSTWSPSSSAVTTEFNLSGLVYGAEDGQSLKGATVKFYKIADIFQSHTDVVSTDDTASTSDDATTPDASETEAETPSYVVEDGIYTATTDEAGKYEIPVFRTGVYTVTAEFEGYLPLTIQTMAIQEGFVMPDITLVKKPSDSANISNIVPVKVVDAVTGEGIEAAIIYARSTWNNYTGDNHSAWISTAADGTASCELFKGYYTLEIKKDGYTSSYINIAVGETVPYVNAVLIPINETTEEAEFRIVLTWGEYPYDLDSHLVGPMNEEEWSHIYFGHSMVFDADNNLVAQLDVDDTESYGPETVTIYRTQSDKEYFYSVMDYTDYDDGIWDSNEMSMSGANVKVYRGTELIKEFNIAQNQTGIVWNVFKIVGNEIIPIDNVNSDIDTIFGSYESYLTHNTYNALNK